MFYYTTTIDRYDMDDTVAAMEKKINSLVKKHNPFKIVTTVEPLDTAFPTVPVTCFHLAMTMDVDFKDDRALLNFHGALVEALKDIGRMNDACYIVVEPPKKMGAPNK